jgi:hypothetical protein
MVRRKDSEDEPETLLDIVRRARVLARALSEPDRTRILEYVEELEAEVAALKSGNGQAIARSQQKPRRPTERSVGSPKAAAAKVLRK